MTVVITGAGVVSPCGDTPESFYQSMMNGDRVAGPVELFDASAFRCRSALEIKQFDPKAYLGKKNFRPLNRPALFAIIAAGRALEQAGLEMDDPRRAEVGLVLGTVYCSVRTIAEFDRNAITSGPKYARPMDFANTVINAAAGQTALWHHLQGINSTISGGSASGLGALAYAGDLIKFGRADMLAAGGVEELCMESFHAFDQAGRLAGSRDERVIPTPFDARRTGFLLGEGAAFLILESAESAAARDAEVFGQIRGWYGRFDASRGQDAERAGASIERTIQGALDDAGLTVNDIDLIAASAAGDAGDDLEAQVLGRMFGDRVPIFAPKAHFGEALGAAGPMQALAALESLRAGHMPGTPGLEQPTTGLAQATVTSGPRQVAKAQHALVNGFSSDGNSWSLIISLPDAAQ